MYAADSCKNCGMEAVKKETNLATNDFQFVATRNKRVKAKLKSGISSNILHSEMYGIYFVFCIILVVFVSCTSAQFGRFADIQGDYCSRRIGGCCPGRVDDCSTPILGTLCYCDHFCNRTDNPDCCPDFWTSCLGMEFESKKPPEEVNKNGRCFFNGQFYPFGATVKINCNQCKCDRSPADPSQFELLCERDDCVIDASLVQTLNEGDYTWSAGNYSEFWGRKLSDALLYKLGTLEPERGVRNMEPIKYVYDETSIPTSFDARTKWPSMIHAVQDQAWCGSDWAFTTSAVTADRLAIQSKGVENLKLSAQQLISCNSRGQQGCQGGHLDRAWNFMRKYGVVDDDCYPYESGSSGSKGSCKISRKIKSLLEINQCRSSNLLSGRTELYRSQPPYKISSRENDIKYEIMTYGPVQAAMSVSPDFFMYRGGVYKKSGLRPTERTGYHSIRLIGWGEEFHQGSMVKYWLAYNTWGSNWGENGLFKILRGENECDVETFVVAAWARAANKASYRNGYNGNGYNGNGHNGNGYNGNGYNGNDYNGSPFRF